MNSTNEAKLEAKLGDKHVNEGGEKEDVKKEAK